jgi:hypothetical protein
MTLRVVAALRPGLWADEIFSLATATGHSLEHPPATADPSLGDFVEPRSAVSPGFFNRYTEQEERPGVVRRVLRAVLLSDTSPPLYYLLLNRWSRAFGTSDAALRLFSVWWALLSLPLLWLIGRELGGPRVAWSSCLLFCFSPVALFYSVEGRMYSLVCCLALLLGWLTLQLVSAHRGSWLSASWVLVGAAGLLTHYFFAFVWVACLGWLWLNGRDARLRILGFGMLTVLAVLPWYLEVPASLSRWRVTGGWLNGELEFPAALLKPFVLAGTLLSGSTYLGGWKRADTLIGVVLLLVAIWLVRHGSLRRLFSNRALLLWMWLAAACMGPLVFDLLRHTTTTDVPRYVLPGLPAAVLLVAFGLSLLPLEFYLFGVGTILLAWLPGSVATTSKIPRPWEPYYQVAGGLESWGHPDDLVLISSIPSGVIGFSRYLSPRISLASWIPQLDIRQIPADIEALVQDRRRVALVRMHEAGAQPPAEEWLRTHGRLIGTEKFGKSSAKVLYFAPLPGDTIFRSAAAMGRRASE